MEVVPESEANEHDNEVYYLPHQCVFEEDSTTTKLRVVCDNSAKTSNGVFLNESLMVGPVVQNDLFTILNQFRFKPIALSAEIAKMYRQVALDAPDKDFHRLLWKNRKDDKIKHMRMKRVTYGSASAFHIPLAAAVSRLLIEPKILGLQMRSTILSTSMTSWVVLRVWSTEIKDL